MRELDDDGNGTLDFKEFLIAAESRLSQKCACCSLLLDSSRTPLARPQFRCRSELASVTVLFMGRGRGEGELLFCCYI